MFDYKRGGAIHRKVAGMVTEEMAKPTSDCYTSNPLQFARDFLAVPEHKGKFIQCTKSMREAYPDMGLKDAKDIMDLATGRFVWSASGRSGEEVLGDLLEPYRPLSRVDILRAARLLAQEGERRAKAHNLL